MELFDGPLTATVDPAVRVQLAEVAKSLSGVERAMLSAKNASPQVAAAARQLQEQFRAGFISAEQLRSGLQGLVADGLPKTAEQLRKTAEATKTTREQLLHMASSAVTVVRGIADIGSAAVSAAQGAWQLAQRMAALATEQANLDRNSQRLRLDFDEAAEAAGRFVDETEVMAAANRAAAAGVRLSQEELNALSRTAARFSQDTGRPINQVFEELTQGLLHGTRGLREFGPGLAALAGPAHTAGERLAAMVREAERLTPATDDATSAMARFQDSIEDAERTMASAFVAEVARIHEMSGALDGARGDAEDLNLQLRAAGSTAAALAMGVVGLGGAMVGALGAAFTVVIAPMRQAFLALQRASERDWRGAVGALAGVGATTSEDAMDALRFSQNSAVVALTAIGRLGAGEQTTEGLGTVGGSMTFSEADVAEINADAQARLRRGGGGGGGRQQEEDPALALLWASSNARKLAEDERMGLLTGQNRSPAETLAESLSGLTGSLGDFDTREQEIRDAAERTNAESAREAARREYQNRLSTRLQGDEESPEARAAKDIASAWGEATDALGTHLGLIATGQETWADFWDGLAVAGQKALAEVAMTEGKVEFGRALGALALGNFPGAALHFAAGVALTGVGAALSATAGASKDVQGVGRDGAGPGGRGAASQRVPEVTPRESSKSAPVTLTVNFGGASFYGSGGPRQAAAELVDLLNRNGHLSGATLDPRLLPA